ncbi:anthocyanidin 3-o-glucoside 6''-o-acyltransferase [Phtheirospermum japonicum]|uniref:Anthocyanidin 3-o-glucoside 6''-o-acyltransferase n=1 Tax=Phtheirospermum japonicum TaxID=374723 RepID=A0A830C9T7_9LAMI|nr:anthocyanidin 3-o-glucoside 6''-o-acyltransferase [Phtheirospermum japonicum]
MPANYFGNCVALLVKAGAKAQGSEKGWARGVCEGGRRRLGRRLRRMCIMRMRFCVVPRSGRRSTGSLSESGSMGWRDRRGSTSTQRITGGEKAKKLEALFIDDGAVLSLCKSRDFEGGLEIVLSKPKPQMDAFFSSV